MKTLYLLYDEDDELIGVTDNREGVERIKDEKLNSYPQEYNLQHETDFKVKEIYADLEGCGL